MKNVNAPRQSDTVRPRASQESDVFEKNGHMKMPPEKVIGVAQVGNESAQAVGPRPETVLQYLKHVAARKLREGRSAS